MYTHKTVEAEVFSTTKVIRESDYSRDIFVQKLQWNKAGDPWFYPEIKMEPLKVSFKRIGL